jgi:hypothetical protein
MDDTGLGPVVAAARQFPDAFLAAWLDGPRELAAAAWLGLGLRQLQALQLCRPPRSGQDVAAIAAYLGTDPARLGTVLSVLAGYAGTVPA